MSMVLDLTVILRILSPNRAPRTRANVDVRIARAARQHGLHTGEQQREADGELGALCDRRIVWRPGSGVPDGEERVRHELQLAIEA